MRALPNAGEANAAALLRRHLTSVQRNDLETSYQFTVRAESGVEYILGYSSSCNILRPKQARFLRDRRYCLLLSLDTLIPLLLLAQKLLIETDEDRFLAVARAGDG